MESQENGLHSFFRAIFETGDGNVLYVRTIDGQGGGTGGDISPWLVKLEDLKFQFGVLDRPQVPIRTFRQTSSTVLGFQNEQSKQKIDGNVIIWS